MVLMILYMIRIDTNGFCSILFFNDFCIGNSPLNREELPAKREDTFMSIILKEIFPSGARDKQVCLLQD